MRSSDRSKIYKYAAIVLAIIFIVSGGFFFLELWESKQGDFSVIDPENPYIKYEGKKYKLKDNIETFLVLGLDKYDGETSSDSYNNDKQADFLMLFIFDNDKNTCSAIQINRDTMAEINVLGVAGNPVDTVVKQIALAHSYGNGKEVSCRNTADAVSELLYGMKIDHYISATMDAVPIYNDFIGGVEIEVLDDFTGIDASLIKGENVTLTGEQALTYVRSRYGLEDSSNDARMKRQRQYINALYQKTLDRIDADEEFAVNATLKVSEYLVSNQSVTRLQELLEKFAQYEFLGITGIKGESKVGDKFMEFYPDKKSLEKVVVEAFYELAD